MELEREQRRLFEQYAPSQPICVRWSRVPSQISSDDMDAVERHVVLLYQRTSALSHVDEVRKQMFAFGNRKIENIPPTLHALEQQICGAGRD